MSPADTSSEPAGNAPDAAQFKARYGPWAVIAGASDGTGAEFSGQLAALGLNLLLVFLVIGQRRPEAEIAFEPWRHERFAAAGRQV